MPTSPRGSLKFFISGAEGISSVIRDQRRKGLRIASNTPPVLSLSKVGHHRGSGDRICSPTRLPSPVAPTTSKLLSPRVRTPAWDATRDFEQPEISPGRPNTKLQRGGGIGLQHLSRHRSWR